MDSWVTNASMDLSTVEYDQARGAGARGDVPAADAPALLCRRPDEHLVGPPEGIVIPVQRRTVAPGKRMRLEDDNQTLVAKMLLHGGDGADGLFVR